MGIFLCPWLFVLEAHELPQICFYFRYMNCLLRIFCLTAQICSGLDNLQLYFSSVLDISSPTFKFSYWDNSSLNMTFRHSCLACCMNNSYKHISNIFNFIGIVRQGAPLNLANTCIVYTSCCSGQIKRPFSALLWIADVLGKLLYSSLQNTLDMYYLHSYK
jgi:hypothetical protein